MTQLPAGLLTIEQAAKWTGLTVSTMRRYRMNDFGPAGFKYAGRVVYRVADLEKWISDQREATIRGGRVTARCAAAS